MALTIFFVVIYAGCPLVFFVLSTTRGCNQGWGWPLFCALLFFLSSENPNPGGSFDFDCDSVWLRRDFVAVGETCYACYLAGVDFMLPFAPLFFCAISSMLGHEAYVFRRPSD